MPCVLAVGLLGIPAIANAESSERSYLAPGKSARISVTKIKRRGRGVRIHLPIGPSYTYYDYPYYYSRGYYPTHIGGYVYYPYDYRSHYWGNNRNPALPASRAPRRN